MYYNWVGIAAEPGMFGDLEEERVEMGEATVGGMKEQEIVNSHQLWKE